MIRRAVAVVLVLGAVTIVVATPTLPLTPVQRVVTLADPEVQALVARMYERNLEVQGAGQLLVIEVDRLEKENATLKAKLGCS